MLLHTILVISYFILNISCSADIFEFGKVHLLTADVFNQALKKVDVSMVEFYVPSCGHCTTLAPLYEDAAKQLESRRVGMFKINCADHADLCNAHDIKGYPTLKSFFKDKVYEEFESHDGPMIVDYMTRLTFPPIQKVEKLEDLKSFLSENMDIKFICLAPESSEEFKLFAKVAHKNRSKALFLSTTFPEAIKELDVPENTKILSYKNFDEKKTPMKEEITFENLDKFVLTEILPLLGDIDDNNFTRYVDAGIPIMFLFYVKDEDKTALKAELKKVAEKYRGTFSFAFIDAFKYNGHAEFLGLKSETFPAIAVQNFVTSLKYPFSEQGKFTSKQVEEFLASIVNKSANPHYRSSPVPSKDEGAVKTIVYYNFNDLIMDENKDALVEFYTTWCPSCNRFAPIYEQIGEAYINSSDTFVIGKMDLDSNDRPKDVELTINTIPALYLFPSNKKKTPIRYQGDYSKESIISFVEENSRFKHTVVQLDYEQGDVDDDQDHEEL